MDVVHKAHSSLTTKPCIRPVPNVVEKLPVFLCCNSKSYLFCLLLLLVLILLITGYNLAQTK